MLVTDSTYKTHAITYKNLITYDWKIILVGIKSVSKVISNESATNYNMLFRVFEMIYLIEYVLY